MSDENNETGQGGGLNPKLKSGEDDMYDTETPTRPPADSASVQREEGRSWPAIWLTVGVICVLVALYLIFG